MLPSRSTMPAPYDQRMHSASFWRCARGPSPVSTGHSTCYNPPDTLKHNVSVYMTSLLFIAVTHNYPKNEDKYKMHYPDLCSWLLFCFLYIYNCTVGLAFNKKHWIFSTPRYSVCSLPSHSTHHSLGCTGCLRWERSVFWKDLRSRLCLVWRAAACRGANHLPSMPHHPDSHLNHIKDKTKMKLLLSLLNETKTQLLYGSKFPLCGVKILRCNETVGTISGHEFRILV